LVDKLETFLRRYNELSKKLANPDIISNSESFKKFSIEFKEIEPIVLKYGELKKVEHDILEAKELSDSEDGELSSFGKEELEELQRKKESILADIKLFLIPKDPLEDKNIIMEIRAGVGGGEAALFARDLFRMYIGFAEKSGWKTELLDSHSTDIGGFKEVIFSISGKDVYKYLKYEIGVHRVQRVPETEASGRIHTSTATVAVLPEAEEVDYEINPDDLRIDVFHASGHGGQNVQKVATAIRIVHKPTGIMVTCQDERSQLQNKVKAMRILRARLFDMYEQEKEKEIVDKRRAQIGRGNRNERIRTYNFPQGRVTDHRINISLFNIQEFMEGNIDELVNSLIEEEQKEKLEEIEN
jgi:peptide chain release factor 1